MQSGPAFTGVSGEFYPAFSTINSAARLQVNVGGRRPFKYGPPAASTPTGSLTTRLISDMRAAASARRQEAIEFEKREWAVLVPHSHLQESVAVHAHSYACICAMQRMPPK
jgi:hypothetical protein